MADLNRSGRSYARSLISSGRVDKTTAWSFSAEDGNKLLGPNGGDWANYGKHHLGVDPNENFDTKDHWKYPFAKESTLYRSGLVAVRQRAGQQKDKTIFDAAGSLLDELGVLRRGERLLVGVGVHQPPRPRHGVDERRHEDEVDERR